MGDKAWIARRASDTGPANEFSSML